MGRNDILFGIVLICAAGLVQGQVTCTQAGRFPDPSDTTCQSYTLCVAVTANSTYIGYNYTCPTTSVFNPTTALCTAPANYVCNVTAAANTNASLCTADSFIADPTSTDCTSYIQCISTNGTFDQSTLTCPPNTFYDPATTLCETSYVCPNATTSAPATPLCTAAGRFADTTDTTCQAYYLCVLDTTGTSYLQYNYTCPTTSLFNPTTALCTTNYVCTN